MPPMHANDEMAKSRSPMSFKTLNANTTKNQMTLTANGNDHHEIHAAGAIKYAKKPKLQSNGKPQLYQQKGKTTGAKHDKDRKTPRAGTKKPIVTKPTEDNADNTSNNSCITHFTS